MTGLNRIAQRFVGAIDKAERGLLSCGYHDPDRFHAACREYEIGYYHFADRNHADL